MAVSPTRRLVVAFVSGFVAVVLVVIATVAVEVWRFRAAEPRPLDGSGMLTHARAYLAAVAAGDTTKALAMTPDPSLDTADLGDQAVMTLLSDAMLASAVERISDPTITDSWTRSVAPGESKGDLHEAGHVNVSYRLAGTTYSTILLYGYSAGTWRLSRGLTGELGVYTSSRMDPIPFVSGGLLSTRDATCAAQKHCLPMIFQVFPAVYHLQPQIDATWKISPQATCLGGRAGCWDKDVAVPAGHEAVLELDVEPPAS